MHNQIMELVLLSHNGSDRGASATDHWSASAHILNPHNVWMLSCNNCAMAQPFNIVHKDAALLMSAYQLWHMWRNLSRPKTQRFRISIDKITG